MRNQSIKAAPAIETELLVELDKDIRKYTDIHGLVNYLDTCFQDREASGDPAERVEIALEGLSSATRKELDAFIAKIELHPAH